MTYISYTLLALILPSLFWYSIILFVNNKRNIELNIYELVPVSFLIWTWILTILIFLMMWAWFVFNLTVSLWIQLIWLIILVLLVFLRKKNNLNFYKKNSNTIWKINYPLLLSWVILIFWWVFSSFFIVLNTPAYPDDATSNWNFRSKVIYHTQSLNLDKREDTRLFNWWTYSNYPLLVPIYKAYSAFSIWKYDDRITNMISPICFMLIMLTIFWSLINSFSLSYSIFSTSLLVMIPLFWIHSINTYSEIILIAYILSLLSILKKFIESPDNRELIYIWWLLAWLLWWIKNEWFIAFYVWITLAFILVYIKNPLCIVSKKLISDKKKEIKNIILYLLTSIWTFSFFLIFRKIYWLSIWSWSSSIMQWQTTIQFHPEIFKSLKIILFSFWSFNLIFWIFIFCIIFWWKEILKNNQKLFLFLSILFPTLIFIATFLLTENYQSPLNWDSRQFLMIAIMVYYFLAHLFLEKLNTNNE